MLLEILTGTMEPPQYNGTTFPPLNITTFMDIIPPSNTTVEKIRTIAPTKMDVLQESTKASEPEVRVPPFNIAQLFHGHGGHNQGVTGADSRHNHPIGVVEKNLTHGDAHGNVILNFIKNGDMETGFMTAGVAVCLTMILLGVLYILRKRRQGYFQIPTSSDAKKYDYFYKPSGGNTLDDEYENTFVGVSVPLLQEVTKV